MKLFSLIFALLLPLAALAGGNGSGNVSNVAGLGDFGLTTSPSFYTSIPSGVVPFSLFGGDSSSSLTGGDFYPLYGGPAVAGGGAVGDGTAYKVSAGKTAFCYNITASTATTGPYTFQLVSATASFTYGQSTALTGGVYSSGQAAKYNFQTPSAVQYQKIPGSYQFAASTYVGFQAGNSQAYSMHLDCYEN